jgi:hypothetical protein
MRLVGQTNPLFGYKQQTVASQIDDQFLQPGFVLRSIIGAYSLP